MKHAPFFVWRRRGMIRSLLQITIVTILYFSGGVALGQNRPAFCEQIPDALLGGLQAPYAQMISPDGKSYCEGLLVNPIALLPPSVVSLKQSQVSVRPFASGGTASLNWCDDPTQPIHIRLRSAKVPFFGLDALQPGAFKWRTDVIATWQPNWNNLAAIGTREVAIAGHKYTVFVPVRIGAGYSSIYSFMLHSQTPISLSKVLVQPIEPSGNPQLIDISLMNGPSKSTWLVSVSFATFRTGIYRVTFEESADDAGLATVPIYLLHKTCVPHE
jgi:hypothetical protein